MRLGLGEEVSNLNLRREIVEGHYLITHGATSKVSIDTNMLGELMFDRISSNLHSTSTVTVKWCRRCNVDSKILKNPSEPNKLTYRNC